MEKRFKTIEISSGRFEQDRLRFVTVHSKNLGGRGDICVFIPPGISPGVPLVILLHGVYGSAWSWALSGGVHHSAFSLMDSGAIPPMIIAMPSDGLWGDGSAYLPHSGHDFEKWIAEDVPALMQEIFTEVTEQSPCFIGGLSMGGFGALRIGAKYHERFSGISAHSSITSLEQMKYFTKEDLQLYAQPDKTDEDVLVTMMRYKDHLPPLRFDCGEEDELITYNRRLHEALEREGLQHEYHEFPGGHQWAYWEEHVKDSLRFFAGLLRP